MCITPCTGGHQLHPLHHGTTTSPPRCSALAKARHWSWFEMKMFQKGLSPHPVLIAGDGCTCAWEPRTAPVMLPVTETGASSHSETFHNLTPLKADPSDSLESPWATPWCLHGWFRSRGGRAVAVECLMPRTAPGVSAGSLRLSTSAQTWLNHAHTQALGSSVLSMSCPKTGLWKVEGSQDPQKPQPTTHVGWVSGQASIQGAEGLGLLFFLLETHNFFPSSVHIIREISCQGQLFMVLPQPPTAFYPQGTACPTLAHMKQSDEHPSREHPCSPFLPPGENWVGIVLINYTVCARCLYLLRQGWTSVPCSWKERHWGLWPLWSPNPAVGNQLQKKLWLWTTLGFPQHGTERGVNTFGPRAWSPRRAVESLCAPHTRTTGGVKDAPNAAWNLMGSLCRRLMWHFRQDSVVKLGHLHSDVFSDVSVSSLISP